jgi:hypothetical protein
MGFNDNLTATQRITQKCDDALSKIAAAQFSIKTGLDQANAILSDNAAAIAVIESDILASATGDASQQTAAGMASLALADARLKVQQTVSRLSAAKTTAESL